MIENKISKNRLKKINKLWQLSSGVLASALMTLLFLMLKYQYTSNLFGWLLWFHLPLLMFHEFEEYVLPGGFKHFFNTYTPFSKEPAQDDFPLNERKIFIINMGTWVWIVVGALLAETTPWIGTGAMIFQLVNVAAHLYLMQLIKPGYNPGIITTLFLLIPYIVILTWVTLTQNILSPLEWIYALALGFGGIVSMIHYGNK